MKKVLEIVSIAALALWQQAAASEAKIANPNANAATVDEIVVHGKRSAISVELDRAEMRIDLERERNAVNASLERALAVTVAASGSRTRG